LFGTNLIEAIASEGTVWLEGLDLVAAGVIPEDWDW